MIIYIHGFGGSGQGHKARVFREFFSGGGFVAPSLPTNPELALDTLSELVESFSRFDSVEVIGSSLGGFYALCLSERFPWLRVVLINPSMRPYKTLQRAIGPLGGINFYDGSRYEWNEGHLEVLRSMAPNIYRTEKLLLLTQLGDELLEASDAIGALQGCEQVIEEGGSHSFGGIERHVERIRDFLVGL